MNQRLPVGARRFAFLALAVVLAGSLVWGLVAAFADERLAVARRRQSGPADRLDQRTRQPQPVRRLSSYEIWALNYSYLFGCGDHNQPTLDLATVFPTKQNGGISADGKVWTIKIRSGVKWQDGVPLTAADVAFTYTYIIKNDMTNLTNYTNGIKTVTALDPTTVRIVCAAPKADLEKAIVPILPAHIWAHVSPAAAATTYVTSRPSSAAAPSRRWPSRRAATSRWCATPTGTARSRPSTRSTSSSTRTPTPWSPT